MDLLPIGVGDLLRIVGTVGARRGLTGAGSLLARPQGRPPGRLFFERSISRQTVYDSNRTLRSDPASKSFGAVFLGACYSSPDQRCECFEMHSIIPAYENDAESVLERVRRFD
jgi:hypothetical protein